MDALGTPHGVFALCPAHGVVQLDRRLWRADWGRAVYWDAGAHESPEAVEDVSARRRAARRSP